MNDVWTKTDLPFVDLDEQIEVRRDSLIAAIEALGGPAFSGRATSEQIVAEFKQIVNRVPDTIGEIEAALASPCSTERRAKLMGRRIELDQAARGAKATPTGPHRYFP